MLKIDFRNYRIIPDSDKPRDATVDRQASVAADTRGRALEARADTVTDCIYTTHAVVIGLTRQAPAGGFGSAVDPLTKCVSKTRRGAGGTHPILPCDAR